MIVQMEVILTHIPTSHMIVDPLTKPISRDIFEARVRALAMLCETIISYIDDICYYQIFSFDTQFLSYLAMYFER